MMRALIAVLLLLAASVSAQPSRFGPNEGQVTEIDKDAGEITIHHGPLPELGMDPMAMIFKVADRTLLDRVRKGDRISFKAG